MFLNSLEDSGAPLNLSTSNSAPRATPLRPSATRRHTSGPSTLTSAKIAGITPCDGATSPRPGATATKNE